MNKITSELKEFYSAQFEKFGATSQGVGWNSEQKAIARLDSISGVLRGSEPFTILDVGCGYGALLERLNERKIPHEYTGVDVAENMIKAAAVKYPQASFKCVDIFELDGKPSFDYVVCNGILTQKLSASESEMQEYARNLVKHMFKLCKIGVAFNMLTDRVDFKRESNFYQNPTEMMDFCLEHLTRKVVLDHSGPLFEFTTHLYKE